MSTLEDIEKRVEELEDYKPIINERLAENELAIQKLDERLETQLGKPSADVAQFDSRLRSLALQQENIQNSQLSITRVKLIVEDT